MRWRAEAKRAAKDDLKAEIDREAVNGGLNNPQSVFVITYRAVMGISRTQTLKSTIYFVLTELWKRVLTENNGPGGQMRDGDGSPKDILRRFCRKVKLDQTTGDWEDAGQAVERVINEDEGIMAVLDWAATDVLGQGWCASMQQAIRTMKMEAGDSYDTHYARFRTKLENLPRAAKFGTTDEINYYFDSLPSDIATKARTTYERKRKACEKSGVEPTSEPLQMAYECVESVTMLVVTRQHASGTGSKLPNRSRTRDGAAQVNYLMADEEDEDGWMCYMGNGAGGSKPECSWCKAQGKEFFNHDTRCCFATMNANSQMPKGWRHTYGSLNCIRVLCEYGLDERELERFMPRDQVAQFVKDVKSTSIGDIMPCANKDCHCKTKGEEVRMKMLSRPPTQCDANMALMKVGKELTERISANVSAERVATMQPLFQHECDQSTEHGGSGGGQSSKHLE